MYYVYVIRNEVNQFYIGYSSDLVKRLACHNGGKNLSTKGHQWELVYYEAYINEKYARKREYKLKNNKRMKSFFIKRVEESLSN